MKVRLFWVVFAILLVITIYAWVDLTHLGPFDLSYLRHAHHLFAVTGFLFIFMQFVLSTRMKWIEEGFGLDKMLHYHRYFGRIGVLFITLHGVFFLVYIYLLTGRISPSLYMWIGIVVLAGFLLTAALASNYKKWNLAYETWKNIHLANYALFPFVLIHVFFNAAAGSFFYYLWIAFALAFAFIVLHKLWRFVFIRRNPYEVVDVVQEAENIWSLYFKGKPLSYKPGQFMHLRLLRNGRLSSSHPFTISSSPTWETISVTPKELGDFTSTIKDTQAGDTAYIDAPYGVFSFLNTDAEELVFIAGGIGITPFISMLRYLADKKTPKKVTLFWGNKHERNLCFQDELEKLQNEIEGLDVVLVMSAQEDWQGEQGRINGDLIKKYIDNPEEKVYFICGPPRMSNAVMEALQGLKVPSENIHRELFEL